jgi:hypothetical protein
VSYWSAKSDLDFMLRFRADVFELFKHEGKAEQELRQGGAYMSQRELRDAVKSVATKNDPDGYQAVRLRLAVGVSRAVRIGRELGVPADLRTYPPAAIGGPVIDVNIFEATLTDPSWGGVDRQHTVDTLNRAIGACDERVRVERRRVLNPAWWLWSLVSFVLRIPFILASATGLRVERFETRAGGVVVKVVEAVAIAFVLAKLRLSGS